MASFTNFTLFPAFVLSSDRPPRRASNALAFRTKLPVVRQRIQDEGWCRKRSHVSWVFFTVGISRDFHGIFHGIKHGIAWNETHHDSLW